MEKNIKKRVCWLATVLSAVLVVLFGYWFFLNPHGYWQKKKEAEKNEYMDRRMLWRKSEKMTFQGYQLYYRLSCCLVDSYSRFVHRLAR